MGTDDWEPHPVDIATVKVLEKMGFGGEGVKQAFFGMCKSVDLAREALYAMVDDYARWKTTPEGRKAIRKWHKKHLKLSPKFSRDELRLKIHEGRMRKHRARLGGRK